MNKIVLGLAIGGVIGAAIAAGFGSGAININAININMGVVALSCRTNDEIEQPIRRKIEEAAQRYVADFLNRRIDSMHDAFTDEAKQNVTVESVRNMSDAVRADVSSPKTPVVVRTDFIYGSTGGADRMMCGTGRDNDTASVAVKPVKQQAYAVVEVPFALADVTFTFWLDGDAQWKINSFNVDVSRVTGKKPAELLRLAREQKGKGNNLNAVVLYTAVRRLLKHGPMMQLALEKEVVDEMSRISVAELKGSVPWSWRLDGQDYLVHGVGAVSRNGKLYLGVAYQISPWPTQADLDRQNSEFISRIERRYPMYPEAFDGILVVARERDGRRSNEAIKDAIR